MFQVISTYLLPISDKVHRKRHVEWVSWSFLQLIEPNFKAYTIPTFTGVCTVVLLCFPPCTVYNSNNVTITTCQYKPDKILQNCKQLTTTRHAQFLLLPPADCSSSTHLHKEIAEREFNAVQYEFQVTNT